MNHYEEGINAMWEEVEGKKEQAHISKEKEAWLKFKAEFYGTNMGVQSEWGIIDFNPESMKDVVGGEKLTYDEYLDIMKESGHQCRHYFELCYYDCVWTDFKGQIEKKSKGNICFKRIFVSGMYMDGTSLDGREDHVWMSKEGFEGYKVGDCLSFTAEIYRYLKTGNGKLIDFALRNPENICKIESYEIPSDDDLLAQSIDQIICEVCLFNEHCYMGMCIANDEWREGMRKTLFDAAKGNNVLN